MHYRSSQDSKTFYILYVMSQMGGRGGWEEPKHFKLSFTSTSYRQTREKLPKWLDVCHPETPPMVLITFIKQTRLFEEGMSWMSPK